MRTICKLIEWLLGARKCLTSHPTIINTKLFENNLRKFPGVILLILINNIIQIQKSKNDFSEEMLQLTEKILDVNTECYTVWNYRRTILLEMEK